MPYTCANIELTIATGAAALMSMVLRSVLSSGSSRKITIVISGRTIRRSAVT